MNRMPASDGRGELLDRFRTARARIGSILDWLETNPGANVQAEQLERHSGAFLVFIEELEDSIRMIG